MADLNALINGWLAQVESTGESVQISGDVLSTDQRAVLARLRRAGVRFSLAADPDGRAVLTIYPGRAIARGHEHRST